MAAVVAEFSDPPGSCHAMPCNMPCHASRNMGNDRFCELARTVLRGQLSNQAEVHNSGRPFVLWHLVVLLSLLQSLERSYSLHQQHACQPNNPCAHRKVFIHLCTAQARVQTCQHAASLSIMVQSTKQSSQTLLTKASFMNDRVCIRYAPVTNLKHSSP